MTGVHRTPYWMRFIRKMRPIIQRQLPLPCVECGQPVMPDDAWDIAHLPGLDFVRTGDMHPTAQDVGPAHRRCNRSSGGRLGAAKQKAARSRETRWLAWFVVFWRAVTTPAFGYYSNLSPIQMNGYRR